MVAAPYYLFSFGIVLMIIAYFWSSIAGGSDNTLVDPRMSDDDIQRQLSNSDGSPIPGLIMMAGMLVCLISILWRIGRIFF